MSASWSRVLGLMIVSSWLVVACSSAKKIEAGATCILNTDCNSPLVCSMDKCHDACHKSADCPAGESCITASDQSTVCQLPVETYCVYQSDCKAPLTCAVDQRCHNQCQTDTDCRPGQTCTTTGTCAEPTQVDPNNNLIATDGGVGGSGGASGGGGTGGSIGPNPDASADLPADARGSTGGANSTGGASGGAPGTGGSTSPIPDASPDLPVDAPASTGGTTASGGTTVSGGTTGTGGATNLPDAAADLKTGTPETGAPDLSPATPDSTGDLSSGPDAPAPPPDLAAPDLALDIAVSSPDAPEAGLVCANGCNDGLSCTTDSCVTGVCQNTLSLGYCVIDNACYMDGDTKPGDGCQACNITSSTSAWWPEPEGTRCDIGKSCQSGTCAACGNVGEACCGVSPGTCAVGGACDSGTGKCKADKAIGLSGEHVSFCALFQSGRVRCWGGSGPNLGIGVDTGSNVAAPPVIGLEDAVQVSVGWGGVCAVRATGAVACWGNPVNAGSTNSIVAVPGITNATQVSVGFQHACVRTADSKIMCWGDNSAGEFGDNTTNGGSTPTQMLNILDARKVAACGSATCVLRTGGQVSCTGNRYQNGQTTNALMATDLPTVSTATDLSCSELGIDYWFGEFCAVGQTGTVTCWGVDSSLGNIPPNSVANLGQVMAAVWNGRSYLAIQRDHSLWALGDNNSGQLGDGTFATATSHTIPQLVHLVAPPGNVVAVAIGTAGPAEAYASSCLLRDDGSVSCAGWGGSDWAYVALGDGQAQPAANRTPFVPVVGILPVASEDGQCYDGVDNDGDGKTDLDDPDCAQDLGSATVNPLATVSFTAIFGNYLQETCNGTGGGYGGPEAVLTWTAPSGGTFQLDTSGSSFDTVLAAYRGNPLTAAELACNDDSPTLLNGASAIQVQVITGDKLTIVVDSKAAPTGPASFNLNITKQ